jgi:hypothetical protein
MLEQLTNLYHHVRGKELFRRTPHGRDQAIVWTGRFARAHVENRVGCLPATLFASATRSPESDPR